MRVYTANELQALVEKAWAVGLQDGRTYAKDYEPEPPKLGDLHKHDYGSSLLSAKAKAVKS